jgi:hypothetical protein
MMSLAPKNISTAIARHRMVQRSVGDLSFDAVIKKMATVVIVAKI